MLLYGSQLPERPTFAPSFEGEVAGEKARAAAAQDLWDTTRNLQLYVENSNASLRARTEAYEARNRAIFEATGRQIESPLKFDFDGVPLIRRSSGRYEPDVTGAQARADAEAEWQRQVSSLARDFPQIRGMSGPIDADAMAIVQKAETEAERAAERASEAGVGGARRLINQIGGGIAGGLRDPLQVGTLFVGGGWSSPARSVALRLGETMLSEAALNAGVEGAVQLSSRQWKAENGLDASLSTSLKQVGLAALFGGGFGGLLQGGHEVFRALGREPPAAFGRIAGGNGEPGDGAALAKALDIEPDPEMIRAFEIAIEQDHLDRAAFGPPPAGLAPAEAESLAATAMRLAEDDAPLPGARDLVGRHQTIERIVRQQFPAGKRPRQPQSLLQFLSANGGLKDDAGELAALDAGQWQSRGYEPLLRDSGRSLDQAREIAEEAGYIGRPGQTQVTSVDDLLRAVDDELRGRPRYSPDQDELVQLNAAYDDTLRGREQYRRLVEEVDSAASALGLDRLDDRLIVRATEMVDDDTDAAGALERALDEDYRLYGEDRARGGEQADADEFPFFEDTGAGAGTGRPAGEARGGTAAGPAAPGAAGERLPGAGGDEGTLSREIIPAGEALPEPGTPQAEEAAAQVLTEAGGEAPSPGASSGSAEPRRDAPSSPTEGEETSVWDAMPAGTDAEGHVTFATYQSMIDDAERSEFYAGIVASCRE